MNLPAQIDKMRVLLSVPQCDPQDVGESYWGYRIAAGVAEAVGQCTILTMPKPGCEGRVAQAIPKARVIECREPPIRRYSERFAAIAKPGFAWYYLFARRQIRRLTADQDFDVVHGFTPAAPRFPNPVAATPGRADGGGPRVIAGPFSGGVPTPAGYEQELKAMPWYMRLRWIDDWRRRWDPWLRAGVARADLVLAAAPYVLKYSLADLPVRKAEIFLQIGIDQLPPLPERPLAQPGEPMRLLYVGRMVRSKGAIFLIRALHQLQQQPDPPPLHLDIIGEGEDRTACEAEAAQLPEPSRVTFHGKLTKAQTLAWYGRSDLFSFPSFREPAGNVLLEAMSYGLPIVTMDHGGPGAIVNERFGIKLPTGSPADLPERIATTLRELYHDPQRRQTMGEAARREVAEHHLWPRKIDWLMQQYQQLASERR